MDKKLIGLSLIIGGLIFAFPHEISLLADSLSKKSLKSEKKVLKNEKRRH